MRTKTTLLFNNRAKGFSLIELMVSLAIGLVIVLFVSSLFASTRGSQRLADDNMRIHQDTQFVMSLIGRNLMQAGFGYLNSQKYHDLDGQGLKACDNGFSNPKDESADPECAAEGYPGLQVRYRVPDKHSSSTGAGLDCNGQNADAESDSKGVVTNRFYLSPKSGETLLTLNCAGSGNFAFPQPLLGNVEEMRLTYGVDTDGDKSADRFMDKASDVKDWKSVVSVSVCLQVASDNHVTQEVQKFVDCSGTAKTAPDRRMRAISIRLFTLRNNAAQ